MPDAKATLGREVEGLLDSDPSVPWCVHRLSSRLSRSSEPIPLAALEAAADELVHKGRAHGERVSALSIGVHCQDALYWSVRSTQTNLESFGPEYESPRILHRLASHFECRGL